MNALAASLFGVFVLAKAVAFSGRVLPHSMWALPAYLGQDAAVALAFLAIAHVGGSVRAARVLYAALVIVAAVSACVARVLGSPLTAPMIRAARGALSDSIAHHVTPVNVVALLLILAAGAVLPRLLRLAPAAHGMRPPLSRDRVLMMAGAALGVIGPFAVERVDSWGMELNPVYALAATSFPRVAGLATTADWRASPYANPLPADELRAFHGIARGKNVLLVVLESTAARYLRPWGAAEDPMPSLTSLAQRGTLFENTYAVYPESIKGLLAILSSRYPAFDVEAERHAEAMNPSVASALAAVGYETALFHSGRFMYLGMDAVVSRAGFSRAEDAGDIGGNRNSSFGIDEEGTVRRTLAWIDSLPRGRRFFAAYLPIAGHHPYATSEPGPFSDATEIGRYRNALHEGDRALGLLLAGLRVRGLDRKTLIVVIADHGEAFGQHEGNFGHTLALYDENVRVPLLIVVPGGQRAPLRVSRAASLLDVAPTVLDLLGVAPPVAFEGESLVEGRARMSLFFTDYSAGLLGLRDGCNKFIAELASARSRLFDACRDPDEHDDIGSRDPERVGRYRALLRAWSAAQVARLRAPPFSALVRHPGTGDHTDAGRTAAGKNAACSSPRPVCRRS